MQKENGAVVEEEEFEVEAIRDKKVKKGQVLYLVKWLNWPEDENSWEPIENLSGCPEIVLQFEEKRKQKVEEHPAKKAKSNSAEKRAKYKDVSPPVILLHKPEKQSPVKEKENVVKERKASGSDDVNTGHAVMEIATHHAVQVAAEDCDVAGDRSEKPAAIAPGIEKILRPINYHCATKDGKRDVNISFRALRADAQEVVVDNQYLRCNHPLLLIDFYEDHILCTNAKKT